MVGLLSLLQKVSCADTNVGDAKVRGISGGEKKRLSVACELIASPSVIFADEPTTGNLPFNKLSALLFALVRMFISQYDLMSQCNTISSLFFSYRSRKMTLCHNMLVVFVGLDAFQAEKVMETLRQLAQDGHTVICSIHQPRGSVYAKFDDIVLLTEGALVYAGPAHDEPLTYFSKFGSVAISCTKCYLCPLNHSFFFLPIIMLQPVAVEL